MKFLKQTIYIILSLLSCSASLAQPVDHILPRVDVQSFINEMVLEHQFNSLELNQLFAKVNLQKVVVSKLQHPYEENPWITYKEYFVTNGRVEVGVAIWKKYEETFNEAYKKYGVPPEIILAIMGIETKYGTQLGNFRVIDALSTLTFQNTIQADFFRMELTQYLLYCRKNNIDPLSIYGSYAGAFGIPQFMPSSVMTFAVSSSKDGKIDLMHNMKDAIFSIGNFLDAHGWKSGGTIAVRTIVKQPSRALTLQHSLQKPNLTTVKLSQYGLIPPYHINPKSVFGIFKLDLVNRQPQYWLGFHNFYVIRAYNQSFQYAMAVYSLSREILDARKKQLHKQLHK